MKNYIKKDVVSGRFVVHKDGLIYSCQTYQEAKDIFKNNNLDYELDELIRRFRDDRI